MDPIKFLWWVKTLNYFINKTPCNFIKKETLAQVFSCEFCEISKNTFFTEHLLVTASDVKPLGLTFLAVLNITHDFCQWWFLCALFRSSIIATNCHTNIYITRSFYITRKYLHNAQFLSNHDFCDHLQVSILILTNSSELINFYSLWSRQKTYCFLNISRGIEAN